MTNTYPTLRQTDFLKAVARVAAKLGHAPSASEIGRELGISRAGAAKQLHALEEKGLLQDMPVEVSSGKWRLTPNAKRWLGE